MNPLLFCFYVMTVFGPQPACYQIHQPIVQQQYRGPVTRQQIQAPPALPLAPAPKPATATTFNPADWPPGYVPNPTQLFSGCRVLQPGLTVCA